MRLPSHPVDLQPAELLETADNDPASCFEWTPRRERRSSLVYWRETVKRPAWSITAAFGAVAMIISGWPANALVFVVAVFALTAVVSLLPPVRRSIQRRLEQREEERRRVERAGVRMSLDDSERRGLAALEDIRASLLRRISPVERPGAAEQARLALEASCQVSQMIACYVRCALALRSRRNLLASANRDRLEQTVSSLAKNGGAHPLISPLRELVEERLHRFEAFEDEIRSLELFMAFITHRMKMLDEQCVPPIPPASELWRLFPDVESEPPLAA